MDFSILSKVKAKKVQEKEEFNVEKYLNKAGKLSAYIDTYVINEPVALLEMLEVFEEAATLESKEPVFSLKEMLGE